MALWIDELAGEAADPTEAGRKMRRCFYTLEKITKRQLTVDCLRKLVMRKVGTHEVEGLAKKVIKGEERRNPKIVLSLLQMKLEDALKQVEKAKKQFSREKMSLYMSINRSGMLKEEFWSRVDSKIKKMWVDGKKKVQAKVGRLEDIYKGARGKTGMVGNIRVGDDELGEENVEIKNPLAAGVEVSENEAKVLRKDPRFRDWRKITVQDVETDVAIGLDNLRREIKKVEDNGGKSLSKREEMIERESTNELNLNEKSLDFGKQRSTAMKQNKYFCMSGPVNRKDELVIQRMKDKLIQGAKKVLKTTNDDKGRPRASCYSEEERAGIKALKEKRSNEGVVVCSTDKSQVCGAMSEEEWLASLEVHTKDDPIVSKKEVDEAERKLMGYAFQLARVLRFGEAHGQEDKVRSNLRSEQVSIPNLYALIKDHKEIVEGEAVKVRPVCGATESPNGQLSNILSDFINAITKVEDKYNTECRSSEEMRAGVDEVNNREGEEERIIGSTDFKSYYPSLPIKRTAKIVATMVEQSELSIKTNDVEMGLFLASTLSREEVENVGLGEVVQERLHTRAAAPGITSKEILERGPNCPTKWKPPRRSPSEQERRFMLGKVIELSIIFCMENHFYMLEGKIRRQLKGAGIGLRCSEALGRAFGLDWDQRLIQRLEELSWPPLMIKRYVDDLNAILTAVKPGVRFNQAENKLEVVEELVEEDRNKVKDEVTMKVFGDVANSIDPDIEVEIDFPSKHPSQMLAILDMEMGMLENKVQYKFYRKPMANKYTMMANSAVSDRVKRSTMTNEALRRLLSCSANLEECKKVEVMEDYARLLRRSGYSERFRHEVISDAIKGHQKLRQEVSDGKRPLNRPRGFQEDERRRRRQEKGERWYRREERGSKVREGLFIIPPTPESLLAKTFKKICIEELKGTNIAMAVTERGGRRLAEELGCTVPGKSAKEHCKREKCFTCNTGQLGMCRRTGLGYQIECMVCSLQLESKYAGETGKNIFQRGSQYVDDVDKKRGNKPLWKHIEEKHGGVMSVPMFSHFKMEVVQFFTSAQRRKADEGVRIAHLNPDTRMNSKDEFLQGTNLFLVPVRGVGM